MNATSSMPLAEFKPVDGVVASLDMAQMALERCLNIFEAKKAADVAESLRVFLERTQASAETINRAVEIRLLAERQMGKFLLNSPKNEGSRGQLQGSDASGGVLREPPENLAPTLAEIGLSKKEASRCQRLALLPEDEFSGRVAKAKAAGRLTINAVAPKSTPSAMPKVYNFSIFQRRVASLPSVEPQTASKKAADLLGEMQSKDFHGVRPQLANLLLIVAQLAKQDGYSLRIVAETALINAQ